MRHNMLEDTHAELPIVTSGEVRQLIQDMSIASFAVERDLVWQKPKEVRLLKLYDKISSLLDASHYSKAKWNNYVEFTQLLIDDVEDNFGYSNIINRTCDRCSEVGLN
jgi:hypothetical protein